MKPNEVLEAAREEQRIRDLEYRAKSLEQEKAAHERRRLADEDLFPNLRPASVGDYLQWLKGYIENGGKPSHVYDYPFSRWKWYVATRNIEPIALYGFKAVNIIVPVHVEVGVGNWGHCDLFYMDGYRFTGIVPIFEDTNFSNG